jgi:hypothetical protein
MAIKLTPGNLYFIRDIDYLTKEVGKYVKIGIVTNNRTTEQRKKEHQTGNPRGIFDIHEVTDVPFVERLETQIHYEHIDRWITGEWFLLDDKEAKAVYERALVIKAEQIARQKTIRKVLEVYSESSSNGVKLKANKKAIDLETKYLQLKSELNILAAQIEISKKALCDLLGPNGSIEGVLRIGFTEESLIFDEAAFALAHPKDYKRFLKSKPDKLSAKFTMDKTTTVSLAKIDPALAAQKSSLGKMNFTKTQLGNKLSRDKVSETLHWNHLQLLRDEKIREYEIEMVQYEIQAMVGKSEGIEGICTWSRKMTSVADSFDVTAFKAAKPKLYEKYCTKPKNAIFSVEVEKFRAYKPR